MQYVFLNIIVLQAYNMGCATGQERNYQVIPSINDENVKETPDIVNYFFASLTRTLALTSSPSMAYLF
jgi:hypothetical protein